MLCVHCKSALYCSHECQQADEVHPLMCTRLLHATQVGPLACIFVLHASTGAGFHVPSYRGVVNEDLCWLAAAAVTV